MTGKKSVLSNLTFSFKVVLQVIGLTFVAAMWWFSHNQTMDTLKTGNEKVGQVYEKQEVQEEKIEEINVRQMEVQETVESLYPKVDATLGVVKSAHGLAEYRVVSGDSWWTVAEKLRQNPTNLRTYNEHIANVNELDVGMIIFYPRPDASGSASLPHEEDVPN